MGTFTIDGNAHAIRSVSSGIKNALNNVMRADSAKQEAYLDTMGKTKSAEEARGLKMTNDYRESVDRMIAEDPGMPQYKKNQLVALKLLGGQHMDNFSRSGEIEQRIAHRDAVLKDPSLATTTAQAHAATSGKAPFDNIGNSGHSVNQVTGEQVVAHPGLAKLFNAKEGALAAQRGAAAGEHGARTVRIQSGLDHTVTTLDASGKPMVTALPTGGAPVHIAPAKQTTSVADSTNGQKMAINKLPDGAKLIGTSGGKPVYLAPNGKKYIPE